MIIRESTTKDIDAIYQLHESAFGASEGTIVAKLARDILRDATAAPLLSLVAEHDNTIIGNIIFSSVKLTGQIDLKVRILAPLAVIEKHQKQGVGTKLIRQGNELLEKHGVDIVLVLGDPKYYSRVGFKNKHKIEPPYKLDYPEAWQAIELTPGAIDKAAGIAMCASSLNSAELW